MAPQLTGRQRRLATTYVETEIGVKASLAAYNANAIAAKKMNLERIATKR